jgi:hypothetical protein
LTFLLPRKLHDAISLRLQSGLKCSFDPLTIFRRRSQASASALSCSLFHRTRAYISGGSFFVVIQFSVT